MTAVGDARKRQAVENTRRVRVTVEGDAVGWPGSSVLRVYVGASQVVTVDPSWAGVSVEDAQLERVWTDGDVLVDDQEGASGWVWTRKNGRWVTHENRRAVATDADINHDLNAGYSRVLRYQAGE